MLEIPGKYELPRREIEQRRRVSVTAIITLPHSCLRGANMARFILILPIEMDHRRIKVPYYNSFFPKWRICNTKKKIYIYWISFLLKKKTNKNLIWFDFDVYIMQVCLGFDDSTWAITSIFLHKLEQMCTCAGNKAALSGALRVVSVATALDTVHSFEAK